MRLQSMVTTAVLPKGARAIRVSMLAKRTDGQYDSAYFDNLVLLATQP